MTYSEYHLEGKEYPHWKLLTNTKHLTLKDRVHIATQIMDFYCEGQLLEHPINDVDKRTLEQLKKQEQKQKTRTRT